MTEDIKPAGLVAGAKPKADPWAGMAPEQVEAIKAEVAAGKEHAARVDSAFQAFVRTLVVARFGCRTQNAFEKALERVCFQRVEKNGKDLAAVLEKPEKEGGEYKLLGRKPISEILAAGD